MKRPRRENCLSNPARPMYFPVAASLLNNIIIVLLFCRTHGYTVKKLGGIFMKKLALAVALALAACVATFGAEQISAEEAFKIALRPTGNPIIGIWRIHSSSGERAAHMAIVPNTTGRHGSWAYLGIMLEDGFLLRKSGIKIALRPTRFAHTYDVILSNTASRIGAIYLDGNGFAFLDGAVLDMSRVKVPYVETIFYDIERHAPITHMTKVRNFQMETASRTISLSGLYFDGLEVSAVTPEASPTWPA